MPDRFNPILRIVCLLLAGLVLYQIFRLVAQKDPLANLNIAPLSLPVATEAKVESKTTDAVPTNALLTSAVSTNAISTNAISTNAVRTNAILPKTIRAREAPTQQADVPPAVQARVDRITQSEILGAVVRPLPMALLGIAGQDAFLRAPNGQTGLLREGEELGGVKLLRIGTNRVLIEHEQQQKELTVFSGFGSETLLPKGEKNSP